MAGLQYVYNEATTTPTEPTESYTVQASTTASTSVLPSTRNKVKLEIEVVTATKRKYIDLVAFKDVGDNWVVEGVHFGDDIGISLAVSNGQLSVTNSELVAVALYIKLRS